MKLGRYINYTSELNILQARVMQNLIVIPCTEIEVFNFCCVVTDVSENMSCMFRVKSSSQGPLQFKSSFRF
jgi:hypothetical protein